LASWAKNVYIVAEMSANHNQSYDQAVRVLRAAKESGADAIKLQTYTADTLTIPCDNSYFKIGKGTLWEGRTLYDLYNEAYTPWEWHEKLQKEAATLGLDFFSTPFDHTAVDYLEKLNVPAHKIASFEIVDIPLLRYVAQTKKPIIMSTGMSTREEIAEAVDTVRNAGNSQLVLLKCVSAYPAQPEDMNLRTIADLSTTFNVPVGLSDHTMGIVVPVAAVAAGAVMIEKHFTLSRKTPGPDSAFSLEPAEFKAMVESVRMAEKALGGIQYGPSEREQASRVFRRSLFVVNDVKKGEIFSEKNVRSIRPGNGLHPRFFNDIIGRRATQDIQKGTPLSRDLVTPALTEGAKP
jgi:N-acetylneuraminate synthase